jgi:hypothetical protein
LARSDTSAAEAFATRIGLMTDGKSVVRRG